MSEQMFNKNLFLISWLIFLISAITILSGGFILLKWGIDIGIYITYAGFMGLGLSGFFMAIAYGVPS